MAESMAGNMAGSTARGKRKAEDGVTQSGSDTETDTEFDTESKIDLTKGMEGLQDEPRKLGQEAEKSEENFKGSTSRVDGHLSNYTKILMETRKDLRERMERKDKTVKSIFKIIADMRQMLAEPVDGSNEGHEVPKIGESNKD